MLSYGQQQTLAQNAVRDTSSSALTFLKQQINIGKNILEAELGLYSAEKSATETTVASTDEYKLPFDFIKLKVLYVTVSGVRYVATPVYDEDLWQQLKSNGSGVKSDFVSHVMIRRNTFELYPTPSTSSNTITILYEPIQKDLSTDDYTTGTISDLTSGSSAVTGSGTDFDSLTGNLFFKINANGQWYEISQISSDTALTLSREYVGTTISGGSEAFTIGEMMRTPAPTHHIPVEYAAWKYYEMFKVDDTKARGRKSNYMEQMEWARRTFNERTNTSYIPPMRHTRINSGSVNPNWFPSPLT